MIFDDVLALLVSTFMELKFGKQYDLAARGVF